MMKRNCDFQRNRAYVWGLTLMCVSLLCRNALEPAGVMDHLLCLGMGAGAGLSFVGLLYGSPKTRPLFDRFHAFKSQLFKR